MKQVKAYIYFLPVLLLIGSMSACTKMDDYLKYTGGKERLYTGKVDSVIVHSGRERVLLTGLLISDPKITLVKIYWNTRRDSILLNIKRTSGVDSIKVPISLPEGNYNFELITYDADGNSSVQVNASGASYGEVYQQSLFNRSVKRAEKIGNDVVVDWYNGEETSMFTRVTYTDSRDEVHVLDVPNDVATTTLPDFKSLSRIRLQSFFLPDSTSIDTFMAEEQLIGVNEDVTTAYFKNPGAPFLRGDNGSGKWGVPKDWLYNAAVLNQDGNTAGGWSWDAGGVIHLESKDWGGDGLNNAKIYQTFTLPPGNYTAEFYSDGGGSSSFEGNFVAAEGNTLPDITNLSNVLARHQWNQNSMGGTRNISFTIEQPTVVAIGWVVSSGSYSWMHINSIKMRVSN